MKMLRLIVLAIGLLLLGRADVVRAQTTTGFMCNCEEILGVSVAGAPAEFCATNVFDCTNYCNAVRSGVQATQPVGTCSSAADQPTIPPPGPPAGANANPGAQGTAGGIKLQNPLRVDNLPALVNNILRVAIGVVGAVSLLIFIYGGLLWLTSGGEAVKIQAGKDAMKWAAIGLVVIFSSYALVSFVFKLFTG